MEGYLEYMKTKQVCRGVWPPPRYISGREDMISKFPDALISQILLYLPTKEAVKTSVLSTRWKSLWLLIPILDLDSSKFPDYNTFVGFTDKFIDFSREHKSCLHKLKLSIRKNVNDPPCVTRWVDFVVRRKLEHLDVECLVNRKFLEEMPLSLYVCDTLVYLRLHRVSLGEFESVSLTSLKTMRLEENVYANDVVLESLISSCPVLEDLSILRMVKDNVKVLRVRSQTLTSLHVDFYFGAGDEYCVDGFDKKVSGVFIDAPRLEYLKFQDDLSGSKIITNSGSLAKVNVVYVFNESDCADVVDLPKRNMVRNFLTSISGVRDMTISDHFVEFLYYNIDFDPLPQFCNLSCLKVKISLELLEILPTLLESCPHLKSLVLMLEFDPAEEDVQIRFSSVLRCLVSSLEFVEIKYINGWPAIMEVARYFVENSRVLKKLVLHLRCSSHQEGFYMLKELLELPRGSSTCRIIVC
ncbi:PREDICTED: LOW QUALITY PROTEIN: FBD-associated F-box protein At5g22730-like [Camelina sativa]|uniref:LOW QUALITY PROTEIN: FBD-associated F-box protein At5g22730-like n=1 Tax=Camelina sativa TaxID=90675 RepID=A0ABM1QDC1_CAMSA|nr:PREDICTED: LOW QUALITY PROTEIN: FBD-associated F-box protein At5g22730-like [Camelina sativa]